PRTATSAPSAPSAARRSPYRLPRRSTRSRRPNESSRGARRLRLSSRSTPPRLRAHLRSFPDPSAVRRTAAAVRHAARAAKKERARRNPRKEEMRKHMRTFPVLAGALLWAAASGAFAHGFAGKRFFPATLATDDPFVADELSLP